MTFNTLYRIGLIGATIFSMLLALVAEKNEEYIKAIYEMCWVMSFLLLCHWEFDK